MIKRNCKFCASGFEVASKYSNRKFCSTTCRFKSIVPASFNNDTCVVWPKSINKVTGYGQFNISSELVAATMISAHRMSYMAFNGVIFDSAFVCHKCDNRACINPMHLFLGSQQDNITDMWSKNRQQDYKNIQKGKDNSSQKHPENLSRGMAHYASKLNDKEVREIKLSVDSHAKLSRKYKVSAVSISRIREGKTWTHIK